MRRRGRGRRSDDAVGPFVACHNLAVPTVLIQLPGGEGVVRQADGEVLITPDVGADCGQPLYGRDDYRPVGVRRDQDLRIVAGLLPPGAVSVEVVDDQGTRVAATTGPGVYAAIVKLPTGGVEPVVCCRDHSGAPVPRPLPAEWTHTKVVDTQEPCAACGAIDYDEVTPTDGSRGGSGGHGHDGPLEPNRIVVCRRCGHEEGAGTGLTRFSWPDDEDETAKVARIARHRAEARVRKHDSDAMTLLGVTFPIYAADGWPISITGSESRGKDLSMITIGHFAEQNPDPWAAAAFTVTTAIKKHHGGERDQPRSALEMWLHGDYNGPQPDGLSDAATKLWFAARQRDRQAAVRTAVGGERQIIIDGRSQTFLTLSTPTGRWVGSRRHGDLVITIAASSLDITMLTLNPISDLRARLLSREPQELPPETP